MHKLALFVLGLCVLVSVSVGAVLQGRQTNTSPDVMLEKLDCAHKLLDAMALEDFQSIADNAAKLVRLSKLSSWHVLHTLEYSQFSSDFQAAGEALVVAAKGRNTEAGISAYSGLTQACFQCHAHLRRVRKASASR